MIPHLARAWDNLFGHGDAAVTVPPLDGALRPNRRLDEASWRVALPEVDSLAVLSDTLLASSGNTVYALAGETWQRWREYEADIACIAALGDDAIAVALASGDIVVAGGGHDGRRYRAGLDARCITAMAASIHRIPF